MLTKTSLTMMLAGALVAFGTPAALAQNHDRDHHGGGHDRGHAYSQGRGHSNEHHEFRGGEHYRGRDYDRGEHFYRHHDYDHDRNYGHAWGFGFRAPYYGGGYYVTPNPCNPAGFYDQWGNWQWYPGCYAGPPPYYGPGY